MCLDAFCCCTSYKSSECLHFSQWQVSSRCEPLLAWQRSTAYLGSKTWLQTRPRTASGGQQRRLNPSRGASAVSTPTLFRSQHSHFNVNFLESSSTSCELCSAFTCAAFEFESLHQAAASRCRDVLKHWSVEASTLRWGVEVTEPMAQRNDRSRSPATPDSRSFSEKTSMRPSLRAGASPHPPAQLRRALPVQVDLSEYNRVRLRRMH